MYADPEKALSWQQNGQHINSLNIGDIAIEAQQFVLTAGEGNEGLLNSLNIKKPAMQRRPLQMVLCKSKDPSQSLPPLYAHSLGSGSKPIATITSHQNKSGNIVWYIGGNIAENGVGKSLATLADEARTLLTEILPWATLHELEWAAHAVERAEPKQSALSRPDSAFVESKGNVHIAWPTKLALAPDLADKAIEKLQKQGLVKHQHNEQALLAPAPFGDPLWDSAFQ